MSALSTETLPPELLAVRSAVHRLLAPAPQAEKRAHDVAASMGNGGSLSDGLAKAGVAVELSEALALAAPLHPALAIDALVPALARREARRTQLRSAGFYPAIVAMSTLVVAWLFSVDVIPQLDRVRHVIGGTPDPTPLSATIPPVIVSSALLVLFALALAIDLPVLGFRTARALRERAFALAALEGFVRAGAALPAAVRAAGRLAGDPSVASAATAWADALDRGESRPDGLVDGLAGALLSESVKAGTAGASLGPLVASSELHASEVARQALHRVQVASLLVAGLGLLLTAVTFMRAYAGTFGVAS